MKYIVASWTSVLTMLGLDMAIALEFKPFLRPKVMMTANAAESKTV